MKDLILKRPLLLIFLIGLALPSIVRSAEENNYETRLIASADTIASGNWSDALNELNSLTADFPLSRIGHMLKADLLFSLSGQAQARSADPAIAELQKQLRLRWSHVQSAEAKRELVPAKLLQISDKVPFVLYADLPASRLHLFAQQDGTLVRLSDYYITMGRAGSGKEREGDLKTPVGVYQINGYIPGGQLHARYGAGALTTNYPNSLDRFLDRTGYGIWLHGTEPGWINRGPRASEGCLTLSNPDFEQLLIQLGSHQDVPVVIDDAPRWIETQDLHQAKDKVLASITASATRIAESSDHRNALASRYGLDEGARITDLVLYPGKQERVFARWINASQSGDVLSVEQYWHPTGDDGWEILLQTSEPAPAPERLTVDLTQTD